MARTFTVTLPDGTVARRTSKTADYTFAVMVTVDNRARAARLRRQSDEAQRACDLAHEIVASGDLSRLEREHTSTNGAGRKFYSSRVPGISVSHWLPDWRDARSWAEYADDALARMKAEPDKLRAQAAELDAGPALSYGVWRWSQRRDSAEKAARTEYGNLPETTTTVVPCEES